MLASEGHQPAVNRRNYDDLIETIRVLMQARVPRMTKRKSKKAHWMIKTNQKQPNKNLTKWNK